MKHSCTQLREEVRSVHELRVGPFRVTTASIIAGDAVSAAVSRCVVDGHGWEIRFHPSVYVSASGHSYCPGLYLVFLGESSPAGVTAMLSGKVTVHSGDLGGFTPFDERKTVPMAFHRPMDRSPPLYLGEGKILDVCSLAVECAVTVFREREPEGAITVPASGLARDLGELLRSGAGADITFSVSGESIVAHKGVLAMRSPVFLAEFFGEMKEKDSRLVEIQDMDADVFKAMLGFIYSDTVPELDEEPRSAATTALAQHLLVAADRYGLDRLKAMCERRLAFAIDVGTVASTLALAEQQNCAGLKAKCIEFIAGGSHENLDAVLATEGYKHLADSSPLVLTELLKAAHGKKRRRSPNAK